MEVKHTILPSGDQEWRLIANDLLHSKNDLPAIICANGNQRWYRYGKLHRENDRPAVVCKNGNQGWFVNGKLHRENDKPAIITSEDVEYYENGIKIKEEPYSSDIHDKYKFISGRKTKAVNFVVQLEQQN